MKAMVIEKFGGVEQFRWTDWPMPEPKAGEVRIRVQAISINPVDCKMRKGLIPVDLPAVLGRDVAGTIDAVGDGVADFTVGDPVFAVLFGPRSSGAYTQFVTTHTAFVCRKPSALSDLQAATIGVAGLTAYDAVIRKADIEPGETVLVAGGAGGVGSFAIPLLCYRGASPILATAGGGESAEHLMQNLGIEPEHILRYADQPIAQMAERIRQLNEGQGVPVAFDFVGGDMKRLCFEAVGFDGRVVSIVEEPPEFDFNIWRADVSPLFAKSGTYHFVATSARARNGGVNDWRIYRETMSDLAKLIQSKKVQSPKIHALGALSEETLSKAHTLLEGGHVKGKLVLQVG